VEFFFTARRGDLRGGTCRLPQNGGERFTLFFQSAQTHKAHSFAARRDPIGSVKDTRRITQLG